MNIIELLKKRKEQNKSAQIEKTPNKLRAVNSAEEKVEALQKVTLSFFPKDGVWYSSCYKRPCSLEKQNLPSNLRNSAWLVKMYQLELVKKGLKINVNDISNFINNSPFFEKARHDYELSIVKWEIEFIKNGGRGWLLPEGFEDPMSLDINCDMGFREAVVKTLSAIGLDNDAIEEGLEKNSDIWKEQLMEMAFKNRYQPFILSSDKRNITLMSDADNRHKEVWIKNRKYEYYLKHKESMTKYGNSAEETNLTDTELSQMQDFLSEKDSERKQAIKEFRIQNIKNVDLPNSENDTHSL